MAVTIRIPPKLPADRLKRKQTAPNSTVQRIKRNATQAMPGFASIEDELFPRRKPVMSYTLEDHVILYAVDDIPLLVSLNTGEIFPHLRLAIEYPGLLQAVFVDDGAVRALLRQANLMAPGIKGKTAPFDSGAVVEIRLLGASTPFAIGVTQLSSDEITPDTKGVAIVVVHILRDGLWTLRNGLSGRE
jgi:PUA domain protein